VLRKDAVPYGKIEKIPADRDVEDAVPYGKIEKNIGESGRQHLVTFGVLRKDAVPYGKIEKRTPSPR
jgi:predicted nucleotidyltransferase